MCVSEKGKVAVANTISRWIKIAKISDVPISDVQQCQVGEKCIALFNIKGKFFATDDICTHAHAHLSDGYIDEDRIECPLHQGLFHIPTGRAIAAPPTEDLKIYQVRIEGDDVLIEVEE